MSSVQETNDVRQLRWFKSSYSGSDGGDCIEVAASPGIVHVRDSKDADGPVLSFPRGEWHAFVAYAKDGAAERP
jgi:hypothetical protein